MDIFINIILIILAIFTFLLLIYFPKCKQCGKRVSGLKKESDGSKSFAFHCEPCNRRVFAFEYYEKLKKEKANRKEKERIMII